MKKEYKIILSIIAIFLGWLLTGFGFTAKIAHPINTICFLFGLCLSVAGIIYFFYTLIKKIKP